MRIWSIHPKYLDSKGLVAAWREGLLALKVLKGDTNGYIHHPQLERFKDCKNPVQSMSDYLHYLCDEADKREYNFDRSKLLPLSSNPENICITDGQANYEFVLLIHKVLSRTGHWKHNEYGYLLHPMFRLYSGPIMSWEKIKEIA